MKRRLTAAFLITLLPLSLAACASTKSEDSAASPTPEASTSAPSQDSTSEQTVTEACDKIRSNLQQTKTDFEAATQDALTNPQKAVEAFNSLKSSLQSTASLINNAEVKDSLDGVVADMNAVGESIQDVLSNPSADALSDLRASFDQLTTSFTELKDICHFE